MRACFAVVLAGCGFVPIQQQPSDGSRDGTHDVRGSIDGVPERPDAKPDAPPPFAVRYNIAGAQHTGSAQNPGTWLADPEPGGLCDATATVLPAPTGTISIGGSTDFELFNKMTYDAPLDCSVPSIPAGTYTVRMLFAEISRGDAPCVTAATRQLVITVQGNVEPLGDIDVLGNGCAAITSTNNGGGHWFDLSFPNIAINGTLTFEVAGTTANSGATNGIISALEIVGS